MKTNQTITVFSKHPRRIGDIIAIANVNGTDTRKGIVIGKHEDNPRYQNIDIGTGKLVNTGKDMYIVSLGKEQNNV
jgi:hypothetical protein